jgi:protein-disulfide isomerase-like protein with CxxC motif
MFDHERSLVQKYQGRPFALLGVDEDGDRETLQEAQKQYKLNWRSWWDKDNAIAAQWKVNGWPTLVLIDHKGVVRWRQSGAPVPEHRDKWMEQLENRIEQLVKEAESEGNKQAMLSRK